jgi:hypothetical protein
MIAWLLSITKGSFDVFKEGLIAATAAEAAGVAVAEAEAIFV